MSKVNVSLTRAQAVEERQKLLRWLTKERVQSIVEHVEGTSVRGIIRHSLQCALSATRTCDCIISYGQIGDPNEIFIKAKPTSQSFLDSVKQLNQEKLLYSKYNPPHRPNQIKQVIITYDRDKTDDQLLRDQGVWVIRAFDFPLRPYQPIDGV